MIHVHDSWHLKVRRAFLDDIRALHPDSAKYFKERRRQHHAHPIRNGFLCSELIGVYRSWLAKEREWYSAFGLLLPKLVSAKRSKAPMLYHKRKQSNNRPRMFDYSVRIMPDMLVPIFQVNSPVMEV